MNKKDKKELKKKHLEQNPAKVKIYFGEKLIGWIHDPKGDMFWVYGKFIQGPYYSLIKEKLELFAKLDKLSESNNLTESEKIKVEDQKFTILEEFDQLKLTTHQNGWLRDFKVTEGICEFKIMTP